MYLNDRFSFNAFRNPDACLRTALERAVAGANRHRKAVRLFISFVSPCVLILCLGGTGAAFDTFEHFYIGQVAFHEALNQCGNACDKWNFDTVFPNQKAKTLDPDACGENLFLRAWKGYANDTTLNMKSHLASCEEHDLATAAISYIPVDFGDLTALAGDFSEDPEELGEYIRGMQNPRTIHEVKMLLAIRRHLVSACLWMGANVDTCPETLSEPLFPGVPGSTKYTATRAEAAAFEDVPGYVALAQQNKDHFPLDSWAAYSYYHEVAYDKALDYDDNKHQDPKQHKNDLVMAILNEGFAQHFLQDSFASGHIASDWGYEITSGVIFSSPARYTLLTSHDSVNALGLKVRFEHPVQWNLGSLRARASLPERIPSDTELQTNGWIAYGDDSLLLQRANLHREILIAAATQSVAEILEVATARNAPPNVRVKFEPAKNFPVPRTPNLSQPVNALKPGDKPWDTCSYFGNGKSFTKCSSIGSLNRWKGCSIWTLGSQCRSPDFRVPNQPLEGWKIQVSAGVTTGSFVQLGSNLKTVEEKRSVITTEAFDLGYVRTTGPWWPPNYLGIGAKITNQVRSAIYPLSVGYWVSPPSGSYYLGVRLNVGVRLEDSFQRSNPSTNEEASLEMALPVEIGLNLYPPLALFFRAEAFSLNFTNVAESGPFRLRTDSIFNGRTTLSGGIRYDLAGVF